MRTFLRSLFFLLLVISFFVTLAVGLFAFSHPDQTIEFLQRLRPSPTLAPLHLRGIGVIGDSLSDEYRADDRRGLTYAPTTLNWVEILQQQRSLPFGKWGIWEEPRRQGYEFNFARTGASVEMALSGGQHTGLAEEIKKGKVNAAIIYVGVNDFSPLAADGYEPIYFETMSDEDIRKKSNRLVADVKTMIETLQQAGDVRILLITIPDWGRHSLVQLAYPLPEKRSRVSAAIQQTNGELLHLAKAKGVSTANIDEFYEALSQREKDEGLLVATITINKYIPGDDPRDLFLDDGVHPGTIYNGLFANFIISHLNKELGLYLTPLSDQEILSAAGL